MADWEEQIPSGFVRVVGAERAVLTMGSMSALVVHHVVSNDRMDLHFAEEAAFGFDDAEQQDSDRDTDCRVDAVLDAGKDGHKDTGKEDDDF